MPNSKEPNISKDVLRIIKANLFIKSLNSNPDIILLINCWMIWKLQTNKQTFR
jgi:hypothetical protein